MHIAQSSPQSAETNKSKYTQIRLFYDSASFHVGVRFVEIFLDGHEVRRNDGTCCRGRWHPKMASTPFNGLFMQFTIYAGSIRRWKPMKLKAKTLPHIFAGILSFEWEMSDGMSVTSGALFAVNGNLLNNKLCWYGTIHIHFWQTYENYFQHSLCRVWDEVDESFTA